MGRKGGFQPRQIRSVKVGHIAVTATAPAVGPAVTPLFTFSGVKNERDMAPGCGEDIRFQRTINGWPDYRTMMTWGHMVVAHKKKQGLDKMIIFCDNAAVHMNLELNLLFCQNNIRLFGLIPSSTHATQPLDLVFFGLVKPMMETLATKSRVVLSESNVARFWLMAQKELDKRRREQGKSILSDGFRAAGIHPFDPSKSLAKTAYSTAVYQPTEEEIEEARDVGKRAGKLEAAEITAAVEAALAGKVTGAAIVFAPLSAAGIEERIKLGGEKKKPMLEPRSPDARAKYFMETHSYTSESFARAHAAKVAAEEAAEAQKAAKAAALAAKKIADAAEDEAKKAARAADKAAREAKKLQDEEAMVQRKAAKAAAKAAKAAAPPKPAAKPKLAVKRPRVEQEKVEFGPPKRRRG